MFSLKDPSLLAFQDRLEDEGIKSLYKLESVPCDMQMRTILDGIDIEPLNESSFSSISSTLSKRPSRPSDSAG